MFYFRAVRNHSQFKPDSFDLDGAVKGLTDRYGGAISVYEVDGEALADRVGTLLAMFVKVRPEHLSYVLIPDIVLAQAGVQVTASPSDIQHPLMHQTHREVHGLDSIEIRQHLATQIRDHPATIRKRLLPTPQDLGRNAKVELNDPTWSRDAAALIDGKPKWWELVARS